MGDRKEDDAAGGVSECAGCSTMWARLGPGDVIPVKELAVVEREEGRPLS